MLALPDGTSVYSRILLEMQRRYKERLRDGVVPAYYALFAQMLLDVAKDRASGQITSERAELLARELVAILDRFSADAYRLLASSGDGTIAQVAAFVAAAHRSGLEAAAGGVEIAARFERIPERVVALMHARSEAGGLSASFKSLFLRHRQEMIRDIDRFLISAVARGVDANRATRELAAILARGDAELLQVLENVGARGGRLRREIGAEDRAAILAAAEQTGVLKAAKELLFRVRRIVVHETNQGFVAAHLVSSAESPAVALVRWSVSGRHAGLPSSPDVCDVLAAHDAGYGPGLYRPEVCPMLPHPFCGCTPVAVLRPAAEWYSPKPEIAEPRTASPQQVQAILEAHQTRYSRPLTPARVRAATQRANTYARAAYATHTTP